MNGLIKRGGLFPMATRDLTNLLDPLFDDLFNQALRGLPVPVKSLGSYSYPKTDAYVEGDDFVIEAIVPFVKREDLSVELDGNTLSICGETCSDTENDKRQYALRELRRSKFVRKFRLSDEIVAAVKDVDVSLVEGVLKVVFKEVAAKPKPEEVKTSTTLPIGETTKLK